MDKTIIQRFPAYRLDEARDALAKSHARLVRAAAKAGQAPPAAPELVVVAERVESRCRVCKITVEDFPPPNHRCRATNVDASEGGTWTSRNLVDIEIDADRPALAGWDFLAVVEPLEGGNLLRQLPGAAIAEGELDRWRQGQIRCDHCKTSRRRHETFVVRADGSDAAVPAGTYRQVGRNCLAAFLGGRSPAAIVGQFAWEDTIRQLGEDGEGGWGGGQAAEVFSPVVFLAQTAACIRLDGWVSRAAARQIADEGGGATATASRVAYLLTPPFSDPRGGWRRECERCRPIAEDIERGTVALAWAREMTPTSDYERNLVLIARQPSVKRSHMGLLASAVPAYVRVLERECERRREAEARSLTPSHHVGAVKDRLDLELVVQRVTSVDTDYGALHIISMRDRDNNLFVWKTGSTSATPGDRLSVRGTVKKHDEHRGEQQTVLTRCSAELIVFDHPLWPAPVTKRARGAKKVASPCLDDVLAADSCAAHAPISATVTTGYIPTQNCTGRQDCTYGAPGCGESDFTELTP